MSEITVRPFERPDRDQLADLVNAHVAAVVPGVSVSVATLLSRLDRDPGEFIVDRWVSHRATLVSLQRGRVVAGAHLQRYDDTDPVPEHARLVGEISWLVISPDAPFWPDSQLAGDRLVEACLAVLRRWQARTIHAQGDLPAPGVYGVPEQWPHVRSALDRAGFGSNGRVETVWIARVQDLPQQHPAPLDGLRQIRSLGVGGTRLSAVLDGERLGYVELDAGLDAGERSPRTHGLADIGNLWVVPEQRRRGIGRWLLAGARKWLDLGGTTRLLAYTEPGDDEEAGFYARSGFDVLTRTVRDLTLRPQDHR